MRRAFRNAIMLTVLCAVPTVAHGGWVTEWTNTAMKQNGDRLDPQPASMAISGGRVRLEQPEVVTLIDYNAGRFTLMNPAQRSFWSGTIDEYVREVSQSRVAGLREKLGAMEPRNKNTMKLKQPAKEYKPPTIDPAKLPPLSITKTDATAKIAGYDTVKYEVRADGTLFEEIWVAPALDVSSDLDVDRYLAMQRKMSAGMLGKMAGAYNALYVNDEYRTLLAKAFALKIITHHLAGGFERVATSVRQADVPASQFAVPDAYRKVKLSEVISTPQGS